MKALLESLNESLNESFKITWPWPWPWPWPGADFGHFGAFSIEINVFHNEIQ